MNKHKRKRIITNANIKNVIPTIRKNASKYNKETFPNMANSVCRTTGADNNILADLFGVGPKTLASWIHKHKEFKEAVITGRDEYDINTVERRSIEKALGYKYQEETYERKLTGYEINPDTNKQDKDKPIHEMVLTRIEHKQTQGDTTLLIFWLKNRNKDRWRDVNRIEGKIDHKNNQPQITNQTLNVLLSNADNKQLEALETLINQSEMKTIDAN